MIELRLGRLFDLSDIPLEVYVKDFAIQDRVERNFEVCIQACIDLGAHILADYPHSQPETYAAVFRLLGEKKLITPTLSNQLQQMAGFRNLLAHGYADIVAARVHQNLGRLADIQNYIQQLAPYLEKQGVL